MERGKTIAFEKNVKTNIRFVESTKNNTFISLVIIILRHRQHLEDLAA